MFGLEGESYLVVWLYYIWTLGGVVFGNFDCIIFGLEGESYLVVLTVLYLDLRGSCGW